MCTYLVGLRGRRGGLLLSCRMLGESPVCQRLVFCQGHEDIESSVLLGFVFAARFSQWTYEYLVAIAFIRND